MKKGILIAGGIIAAGLLGFVLYKFKVPPPFIVRSFTPSTGAGSFEWGKAGGGFTGTGDFVAGWGWAATLKPDATNPNQYILTVTKNGRPYNTITIRSAGSYSL